MLTGATATLGPDEIVSNAAVMMFVIETSEGMTTSLFWHLLTNPDQLAALRTDRPLATNAIEESFVLEPAAARVDRYATTDVELAGARMQRGDLVVVSLTAANWDPAAFADPDRFDLRRADSRTHVTFAHGPHACVGLHLARLETNAALDAALDGWPGLAIDQGTTPPTGVIFRKPRLRVRWDAPTTRPWTPPQLIGAPGWSGGVDRVRRIMMAVIVGRPALLLGRAYARRPGPGLPAETLVEAVAARPERAELEPGPISSPIARITLVP